jgi:peroxiredoxin
MSQQKELSTTLLNDRISAFNTELAKHAPAAAVETFASESNALQTQGVGSGAPKVGEIAPAFALPDATGREISLQGLLAEGAVVLAFYRGDWCPYCDLQLRAYQEVLPRFLALGARLVAISPQTPDNSLTTSQKRGLEFSVLSDVGNHVARRYGLVFKVSEKLDGVHKGFGVDLAKSNGDASNELPAPAVFVIGRDGRIVLADVHADWRARTEPSAVLGKLEALAASR